MGKNKIIIGIILLTILIVVTVLLTLPKKKKSNKTCGDNEVFVHGSCLDNEYSRTDITKTRYSNFRNIEQGSCAYNNDYSKSINLSEQEKVVQCPLNYPICRGYQHGSVWGKCHAN